MVVSLLAALFVALIAAFWTFQGLFSAAIMFVESIVAMMLAFGLFETVHEAWSGFMPADYSQPAALMLVFLGTLTVLRVLTDKFIPGNMQFPVPVDRAGGGLLGFLSGLTVIGTVLLAIQMLPLGPNLLGFQRYDPAKPTVRNKILLNPDGFVVGVTEMLSQGRFGGEASFGAVRPAFLDELYSTNAGAQRESRRFVPPTALAVKAYWELPTISEVEQIPSSDGWKRTFNDAAPQDPSAKFLACRVAIDWSAADKGEGSPEMIRFTPAQFRLVGPRPMAGPHREPVGYMAVGLSDLFYEKEGFKLTAARAERIVRWPLQEPFGLNDEIAKGLKQGSTYVFDVAFEVPQDFEPWYLAFKSGARTELTEKLKLKAPPPKRGAKPAAAPKPADDESNGAEDDEASAEPKKPRVEVGAPPRGRLHIADALAERTGVMPTLPLALPRSAFPGTTVRGNRFIEGHVVFDDPPEPPEDEAVTEFDVPEGMKIVQIGAEPVFAGSLFGGSMEFAKTAVGQVFVDTASDKQYFAQGIYLAATVDGKYVLEMQYWPTADVPERCLQQPKRLKRNALRAAKNPVIGYIFVVPPGETITRFHTSPRDSQQVTIEVPE